MNEVLVLSAVIIFFLLAYSKEKKGGLIMINQSTGNKAKKDERKWRVEDYVIYCIGLGVDCYYWRRGQNNLLKIVLDDKREIYLDFNLWSNALERACLYIEAVRFPLSFGQICRAFSKGSKSEKKVEVTDQKRDWIIFCVRNQITFSCRENFIVMNLARSSEEEMMRFVLKFSRGGYLKEVRYLAHGKVGTCQLDEDIKAVIKNLMIAKKAS